MELKRCPKGHFYDASKFSTCPHCQNAGADTVNETVSFAASANSGDSPTVSAENPSSVIQTETVAGGKPLTLGKFNNVKRSDTVDGTPPDLNRSRPSDDAKTQGFFESTDPDFEIPPAVGWLVCTVGKHTGKDYRLKAGRNFIGRSTVMDIALDGEPTVSRESHAIVAYEPRQNIFIAQPGSASELFYVNNEVVLNAVVLKRNDRIQIGNAELMLIPCCDENFRWDKQEKKDQ